MTAPAVCSTASKSAHPMRFMLVLLAALAILSAPMARGAENAAQETVLRRQETTIALRKTLQEARLLHRQSDLPAAARMYERTLGLAKELGGASLEHEQAIAMAGWANVQLLQALEEQRKGEFNKAAEFAQKVLDLDPQHKDALDFKRFNAIVEGAHPRRLPSKEAVAKSQQYKREREEIKVTLRDGFLYYQNRMLTEAEEKFRESIRLDPSNEASFYYLKLIQEQRFDEETRKREIAEFNRVSQANGNPSTIPTPPRTPHVRTKTSAERERTAILEKLHLIIIPELEFDGWTLPEVTVFLSEQAKRNDPSPEKKGVNILVNSAVESGALGGGGAPAVRPPSALSAPPRTGSLLPRRTAVTDLDMKSVIVKIQPTVRELTLFQALDAIQKMADQPIRFIVENYGVVFIEDTRQREELFTRSFRVNPATFISECSEVIVENATEKSARGSMGAVGGPVRPRVVTINTTELNHLIRGYFVAAGLNITNYGGAVFFNNLNGLLFVRATKDDLEIVAEILEVPTNIPGEKPPTSGTKAGEPKPTDPKVNPPKSNERGREPSSPDEDKKKPNPPN